jgi:hypothetical protein
MRHRSSNRPRIPQRPQRRPTTLIPRCPPTVRHRRAGLRGAGDRSSDEQRDGSPPPNAWPLMSSTISNRRAITRAHLLRHLQSLCGSACATEAFTRSGASRRELRAHVQSIPAGVLDTRAAVAIGITGATTAVAVMRDRRRRTASGHSARSPRRPDQQSMSWTSDKHCGHESAHDRAKDGHGTRSSTLMPAAGWHNGTTAEPRSA